MIAGQAGTELLQLDGIGVRLAGRQILRDVSFTVRPGGSPPSSGRTARAKTALLRVILGLQAPTSGSGCPGRGEGTPRSG